MPDVTKIQVVAIAKAAIGLGLALGLHVSDARQAAILGFAATVSSALLIADALIRRGRAAIAANPEAMAQIEKPGTPSL